MRSSRRWLRDGAVQQKMRVRRDSGDVRDLTCELMLPSTYSSPATLTPSKHVNWRQKKQGRLSCLGFGLGLVACCICGRLYPKVQAAMLPLSRLLLLLLLAAIMANLYLH